MKKRIKKKVSSQNYDLKSTDDQSRTRVCRKLKVVVEFVLSLSQYSMYVVVLPSKSKPVVVPVEATTSILLLHTTTMNELSACCSAQVFRVLGNP